MLDLFTPVSQTIALAWQARTAGWLDIASSHLVLLCIAQKDVQLRILRVDCQGDVQCRLAPWSCVAGRKAIVEDVEGNRSFVRARQNLPSPWPPLFLAEMHVDPPHDYWFWTGQIDLPRGSAIALIARSKHARVKAYLAGR